MASKRRISSHASARKENTSIDPNSRSEGDDSRVNGISYQYISSLSHTLATKTCSTDQSLSRSRASQLPAHAERELMPSGRGLLATFKVCCSKVNVWNFNGNALQSIKGNSTDSACTCALRLDRRCRSYRPYSYLILIGCSSHSSASSTLDLILDTRHVCMCRRE